MPAAKNVRISADAHADLKKMDDEAGVTLREQMDRLIRRSKRERFFGKLRAQYKCMGTEERASYRAELRALEGPLSDGLDDEEEGW